MRALINELSKLPSIGERSAYRLANHLLTKDSSEVQALASALLEASQSIRLCKICHSYTENEI